MQLIFSFQAVGKLFEKELQQKSKSQNNSLKTQKLKTK
jgi:hypothetical protein